MQGYTIGAIARMTGIPTQTLRSWERRYGVTEPERSGGGRRIYSQQQLEKLRAIKQLLRHGEAIGQLASLDLESLKKRLAVHGLREDGAPGIVQQVAVNVCGTALAGALGTVRFPETMRLGEQRDSLSDCAQLNGLLLVEIEALHERELNILKAFRTRSKASRVILVVGFASSKNNELARAAGFELLPQRLMLASPALALETLLLSDVPERVPVRKFGEPKLAEVLQSSPRLDCECPHHIVGILKQLNAFEAYSQACLSEDDDDAAMHALMYRMTARARSSFEDLLSYLLEHNGAVAKTNTA